ncbi:8-oxo-dGTP pyrophosphatase MutT (NUDIX family) [Microbacterium halimionae]|uniref:8-oxo-dGTP pyrophosphatase MutT (NUDIX family) n=1 Tax=Microbacterium halimionae TaxID=1526413 RepID=A0A7W3JP97_9MICO|nr:NUDIX hydrolase [Microbacterium halimionae]MBA8816454.1 8-oxo-dGTP pyrophosphatase MutT (NUDIX family) [Microbacterium halimionae]NII95359.1 8-oxo-dGTP pyrophosphatase MutT (NUDIX family) [Microbacterium halimionae]
MAWHTQSTRTVYENHWIRVREDEVVGPHGTGIYGVVEMQHPAVFVVAVDERQRICLLTLDRYPTNERSSEVPAGGSDGESPLIAAKRELLEETGYEAADWTWLGQMNALNGIANAPEHVFLARALTTATDATTSQHEEGIDLVEWIPFPEVLERIADGSITDGETIGALMYAGIHLGRFR